MRELFSTRERERKREISNNNNNVSPHANLSNVAKAAVSLKANGLLDEIRSRRESVHVGVTIHRRYCYLAASITSPGILYKRPRRYPTPLVLSSLLRAFNSLRSRRRSRRCVALKSIPE